MFCADAARQYCRMLAVAILVASLAIVDSLNPVTILVAVYLGSTREPRRRLTGFVIGVFSVYLVGGLVLVLGSGELSDKALAGVDCAIEIVIFDRDGALLARSGFRRVH